MTGDTMVTGGGIAVPLLGIGRAGAGGPTTAPSPPAPPFGPATGSPPGVGTPDEGPPVRFKGGPVNGADGGELPKLAPQSEAHG